MSMDHAVEVMRLSSYYRCKFGWELAEVEALFASQGNVCAICGRPPGKTRLNLDHDHEADHVKINVERNTLPPISQKWLAHAVYKHKEFYALGISIKEARDLVKRQLRRASVRGGLCLRCNKGIQMFEDSKAPLLPEKRFENAAQYFRDFNSNFNPN